MILYMIKHSKINSGSLPESYNIPLANLAAGVGHDFSHELMLTPWS